MATNPHNVIARATLAAYGTHEQQYQEWCDRRMDAISQVVNVTRWVAWLAEFRQRAQAEHDATAVAVPVFPQGIDVDPRDLVEAMPE